MRRAILITCFFTNVVLGQQDLRTLNMYTTQNGLSDNTIYCMSQDSRGFLWLGTKEGLNRFDGFRFKKIFAAKEPVTGLANNTIRSIVEYRKGQLLIATSSGLSVFNTLSGSFENEKITKPELKAGSGTLINSLYKDKNGTIWINNSGELDLLDSNLKYKYRFTDLRWVKQLKGIIIGNDNWFTDKQNRLWLFADTSSIQLIDFAQQKIWNKQNNPQQYEFFKSTHIRSALFDESANVLWYAPWGRGIYRYDLNSNTEQQQNFGNKIIQEQLSVNKIIPAVNGKILCTSGMGCFILDATTLKYKQVIIEAPGLNGHLINVLPLSLYKSENNNYWVGTTSGLFQLENEDADSRRLSFDVNGKNISWGECNDIIRSASGSFYISTISNSLIEVKKDQQTFSAYKIEGKKNSDIICILEDKKAELWVGSSAGLYQFNTATKKFIQPQALHPDLYNCRINSLYCDQQGKIWIARREPFGLYVYSPVTGKCEKINNNVTNHFEKVGYSSRVSYITEDKDHVWMISRLGGGIIAYNKISGSWELYPKNEKHKNRLSKGLNYIYADKKNNLWLCDMFGTGLIKYNYTNDSLTLFTRNDGLPSDFIKSISTDGSDNFWILTEYGISRFDMKTEKVVFNSLLRSKPTDPIEFLAFDTLSNMLIAAAYKQLLFYPAESFISTKKDFLYPLIDKIWVNSKEMNVDVNGQSLKLKPGQTNISIDFTVAHYSNADKIQFAYQLSGADHDWKYTDQDRSAQYAVLTPGVYTFKIKLTDENGNWGQAYNTFSFTIVPYFWQTTLFKICVGMSLVIGCWLLVRRRIQGIRHEAEMKKQIAETEMMALRAQMNPHFIFNCLNSIDNLIQNNEKEKATSYLARFAKLIRAILENSKHQLIPVWKDMETLKLYLELESLRFDNKFNYTLDIAEELQQGDYKIPPLLIQPFVENAIHHGLMNKTSDNRNLRIKAGPQNGEIKFIIEDNGIGRQQAEKIKQLNKTQYQSLGQNITGNRIKLFNNDINESIRITDLVNKENEAAGTRVEIILENK